MNWTREQVLGLAPDAASAQAGKGLATVRKWVSTGHDQAAAWGECQGSGAQPYRTQIDLGEPAFRCTCPSRKFPCKHALGLFLLLAAGEVPEGPAPEWVSAWLEQRQQRQTTRKEKSQEPEVVERRQAAQARTAAAREEKVQGGVRELQRWLRDQCRQGLAGLPARPLQEWQKLAARMVDAQAPGLARRVQDLSDLRGTGWQDRLLERLGLLHLLLQAWDRQEHVPEETRADVRAALGFTTAQAELLEGPGVQDLWCVLGQRVEEEEALRVQRTWMWGSRSGRAALTLSFAPAGQALDAGLVPGTSFEGELVFYPGAAPLRALLRGTPNCQPLTAFPPALDLDRAQLAWRRAVSRNPWQERALFVLAGVLPGRLGEDWAVWDESGACLPFEGQNRRGWRLLALSGGQRLGLCAEWDGNRLFPLSAWAADRLVRL